MQDLKTEKRSSDLYIPDNNIINKGTNGWNGSSPVSNVDAEAPLIPSSMSHLGRSQVSSYSPWSVSLKIIGSLHFMKRAYVRAQQMKDKNESHSKYTHPFLLCKEISFFTSSCRSANSFSKLSRFYLNMQWKFS